MDSNQVDSSVHKTNRKRSIFSSVDLVEHYLLSKNPAEDGKEELLEMQHERDCPENPTLWTADDFAPVIQTNQGARGTSSAPINMNWDDGGGCVSYQDFLGVAKILGDGPPGFEHYNENDVLAQRGSLANNHAGNKWYLSQKERLQPLYLAAEHKADKRKIALELVRLVHDRGGKFLRFNKETGRWHELDSKTTLDKAGQTLREKLTAEDRKLKRLKYSTKQLN